MKNTANRQEWRQVATDAGDIRYLLTWKAVKRLNLRVDSQGNIKLSLPLRLEAAQADRFVEEKAAWIKGARSRLLQKQQHRQESPPQPVPDRQTRQLQHEALKESLRQICLHWLPAFAPWQVAMPEIRLRQMKSRWGSCHFKKGVVVLNTLLADLPFSCREYVVVHELAHFVVPNHSPAFHQIMARVMPDYQLRRQALRQHDW